MDKYESHQWIGIILFIILCIILFVIYLKYDRNKRIEEFFENEMISENFENEDSEDEEEDFENEDSEDDEEHFGNYDSEDEEEDFENEDSEDDEEHFGNYDSDDEEEEDEEEYYKGKKGDKKVPPTKPRPGQPFGPNSRQRQRQMEAVKKAQEAKKAKEDAKKANQSQPVKPAQPSQSSQPAPTPKKKGGKKKGGNKKKGGIKKKGGNKKKGGKKKSQVGASQRAVVQAEIARSRAGSGISSGVDKCDIKVDEWNKSPEEIKREKERLSKMMECQVRNIIKENVRNNVMDILSAQKPLMSGPSGPVGPPGPPGSKLQASGRLYNQLGSFESTDTAYERPNMVVSRASGTNPSSSYVFMDKITPFVSYQTWYYNDKNQIINRYDNNCMTYTKGSDKIYMDQCDDNNMRQKWFWDRTNRFVSLDTSDNKGENVRCMNVSTPMTDSLMSSVPDCTGDQCTNKGLKRFLVVGDCGKNTVTSSQLFSFG